MRISRLDIESRILGKEVFQLEDLTDCISFLKEEPGILLKHEPYYIQCQLDSKDLITIHSMEDAGFRFVEFRLNKVLDINAFHKINELAYYPYVLRLIRDEAGFESAKKILRNSVSDDRFSRDPYISDELSQHRLQAYLQKSFDNVENEFIYGLVNKNTGELLAYKSIEVIAGKKIVFCQTALKLGLDIKKYTFMIDALLISHLQEKGIHYFYSISSGLNILEMDLHISELKYKNVSSSVILRKIYR